LVNARALVDRINFRVARGRGPVVGVTLPSAGATPAGTLDRVSAAVLGRPLTDETRATVLRALSTREEDGEVRALAPSQVAGLLLGSPEFQHQ